jgi:hypothetical protein
MLRARFFGLSASSEHQQSLLGQPAKRFPPARVDDIEWRYEGARAVNERLIA